MPWLLLFLSISGVPGSTRVRVAFLLRLFKAKGKSGLLVIVPLLVQ